jgi:hypothetical protein
MKYKCTKQFYLDKYDEEGDKQTRGITVEIGSIWNVNKRSKFGISEVHLVSGCGTKWLEITENRLQTHFKKI